MVNLVRCGFLASEPCHFILNSLHCISCLALGSDGGRNSGTHRLKVSLGQNSEKKARIRLGRKMTNREDCESRLAQGLQCGWDQDRKKYEVDYNAYMQTHLKVKKK